MVEPNLTEDYAEIHVREITDEVSRVSDFLQNKNPVITGMDEYERIVVIDEVGIVSLHAEKKWCRIYMDTADYSCRKRLYEVENMLGKDFMRISKSIIVNLRKIESVEAVFNGMLLSVLCRIRDNSDYTEENTMPKFLLDARR